MLKETVKAVFRFEPCGRELNWGQKRAVHEVPRTKTGAREEKAANEASLGGRRKCGFYDRDVPVARNCANAELAFGVGRQNSIRNDERGGGGGKFHFEVSA